MSYLSKLLPTEGLYCVALLLSNGAFRHFFHEDLKQAETQIEALNKAGHTVYIAQATFKNNQSRKQINALFLRNFFLDIDCGENKDYATQAEAADALSKFIEETNLPAPAVINSGNGLYAQWILEEDVPAATWQTIARVLKNTVDAYEFKTDPTRTADSSSVLRPPGSTNRKPDKPEKPVVIIRDAAPVSFISFVRALHAAAKKKRLDLTPLQPPQPPKDVNAEFYAGLEIQSVPVDAEKIAEKCAQINLLRAERGNLSEPLWYSCLGILAFCEEGRKFAHEWSEGYDGYSQEETDKKLNQWNDAGVGPTTCAKFGADNPSTCLGCPHNGKIKSPIVLGRPEPSALEIPEEQMEPPDGFRRTEKGLCYEDEGRWSIFYDCDLYVSQLAYDESLNYETTTIRHYLPHEGWTDCTVRSSLVNDPKALLTTMADQHIKVVGLKEKKIMCAYIESYQAKLQRQRRMTQLLCQMGWKTARNGSAMFVLGKKIFYEDGTMEDASFAKNVPLAAHGYRSQGDMAKWVKMTEVFDQKNMEPYAFAFLAGGFGAPLMKFTGFDGALVSLLGDSGVGKTLVERVIQSVWGCHTDLMMLRDDTKNALVSRLGVYGNLPMTIDEVTNIDGLDLSDFVYRITQGRDKARLTKTCEERKTLNGWNTLAVSSSNTSLVEKLSGVKHDASAEINRIFEYPVFKHPGFEGQITSNVYWTLHENYGQAGEIYAKWLVTNIKRIKPALEQVRVKIDGDAKIRGDERFWSAVASVAIYGGLIAKSLGLIKFDIAPVMNWATSTIKNMRTDKEDLVGDAAGILGQFLDDCAANRLIVRNSDSAGHITTIIDPPRGPLYVRHEIDTHKIFISRAAFKAWLAKRFGSYTQVKNDLMEIQALKNASRRKVLGAGTYLGGSQQVCLEIDMKCHQLGAVGLQVVKDAEMLQNKEKIS